MESIWEWLENIRESCEYVASNVDACDSIRVVASEKLELVKAFELELTELSKWYPGPPPVDAEVGEEFQIVINDSEAGLYSLFVYKDANGYQLPPEFLDHPLSEHVGEHGEIQAFVVRHRRIMPAPGEKK